MPIIVIFCITGAYSLKNNLWDVGQMLVFGVLGYAMKKLGYSPAALVLALVLGPLAERALRQSLIISDVGLGIFFMRPISAVLTVAALAAVLVPMVRAILGAARRRDAAGRAAG
jgi:putative tricarboxylic transport membrane protein